MNRLRAISMLLIAGFCFLGSLPVYWLQTHVAHERMEHRLKAQIDESQLQKFEFQLVDGVVADPAFALVEDGRELRYHGHYYDIYKVAEEHGRRVYWALADELEDGLLAQMQSRESQDGTGDAAAKTFLKFFGKSFPATALAACMPPRLGVAHVQRSPMLPSPIDLGILSPPPQA